MPGNIAITIHRFKPSIAKFPSRIDFINKVENEYFCRDAIGGMNEGSDEMASNIFREDAVNPSLWNWGK